MEWKLKHTMEKRELIIIGSGPAGLTAAIYAGRANNKPLVFGGLEFGGQLMSTTVVENWPGYENGIDGPKLMQEMMKQAVKYGAELKYENVTKVDFSGDTKKVYVGETEYQADAVIIATGATPRRLGVPGEDKLYGRGVSTCATCDGALYKDKVVAVIGGGDSAMEEATYLTNHASKVYILHRRDEFRASDIMAERVLANEKIEVLWNTTVSEVVATEERFSHLRIKDVKTDEERDLDVDGMFLAIGHTPVTEYLGDQVELVDGYIKSPDGAMTSVDGVFTAGDVQDQVYRQAITAAGMGCRAAIEADRYLSLK